MQVATAFFVSSIFHGFTFPRGAELDSLRYAGFFWIQALCIFVEVTISHLTRENGSKTTDSGLTAYSRMAVRVLWTVAVFYCSAPMYARELVKFQVSMDRPTMLFPMP